MTWINARLEPTPTHLTYLILSTFLILYALFSQFIRNRLHLSEPPLATLIGIIFGPKSLDLIDPTSWGWKDNLTQETTRLILSVQVFAVGVELPRKYFTRHWRSVAMLLGPVMTFGWLLSALFVYLIFKTDFTIALIVSACLTPTDPVLAASVLNTSQFADRVPRRLRHMLSAESGCNDGVSFPFLYIGIYFFLQASAGSAIKEWVLGTLLWQCLLGTILGAIIGVSANHALRLADASSYVGPAFFFVFYFLMAVFCTGVASTLGTDDFLLAFGAGTGFAWDGWFAKKTKDAHLPDVLDLLLNASMFVYFGAIIPWDAFVATEYTPEFSPWKLLGLLVLILLFRRLPIVLALKRWIPDIKTYREALFCGHFGPMGLGALFLVIEAEAHLETNTSLPLPHRPHHHPNKVAIETLYPIVCFIILGSIMVHGLSVAFISVGSHYSRPKGERAPLIGGEMDGLESMIHQEGSDAESDPSVNSDEDPDPN